MGDLSKDFSRDEMVCKCGCDRFELNKDLVRGLQRMRDGYGRRVKINSGFRCEAWNKHEGGKDTSSHLTGDAADIHVYNSKQSFRLIKEALNAAFTRLGDVSTFIHVDVDTKKPQYVMWVY